MKEVLTKSFWKDVKKTFDEALEGPSPAPAAGDASAAPTPEPAPPPASSNEQV